MKKKIIIAIILVAVAIIGYYVYKNWKAKNDAALTIASSGNEVIVEDLETGEQYVVNEPVLNPDQPTVVVSPTKLTR